MPYPLACKTCGLTHAMEPLAPGRVARCVRCCSVLAKHLPDGLNRTAAFALAALILYAPAMLLPIMRLELYGARTENTVWGGVVILWEDHQPILAGIVLLASIIIPVVKLACLFFLVAASKLRWTGGRLARTWLYHIVEGIGRWAMLDVFVLAVLVSLVKLQALGTILPGNGVFAFVCVVVCTLLASYSFDPRTIWSREEQTLDQAQG